MDKIINQKNIKNFISENNKVEDNQITSDKYNTKKNETFGNKENKKIKYRVNFSVKIEYLRRISDIKENLNEVEYESNILLMSSEVNQSNKISCLSLISFVNFKKNNELYVYYLNKKIFKYLQIQKGIESFIYIRTLYRAASLLEISKNYFYAYKYVKEAEILSSNSKITEDSKKLLRDLTIKIENGLRDYSRFYISKFRDIENKNNLNEEKFKKLKSLIEDLIENKYNSKNNTKEYEYLYVINKKWMEKAYSFLKDYINIRNYTIHDNQYFSKVFDKNYIYNNYFEDKEKITQKAKNNYNSFPGLIDNYSISNWTDYWNDPLNEDENNFLNSNLIDNKDYYLLAKSDFEFFKEFFGVTNIVKRRKDFYDFVVFKSIILDKRLKQKNNYFLLRKRNIQIRKESLVSEFKKKILRCIEFSLINIEKEKNEENNGNKEAIKKNSIKNEKNIESNELEINQIQNNNMNSDEINNKYNIYFYKLEKDKKDILIEMCISLVNNISHYNSLYIKNINISDNDNVAKLKEILDEKKYILIIEIQNNEEPLFLKSIDNNKYLCTICQKEIKSIDSSYKCNICHMSLFCSEKCSNKDDNHKKLDEIYFSQYLVEEFDLQSFLRKDLKNFFKPEHLKGLVGLCNLGNTCYMNSSLQCLSNTFDLTKYFLLKYFKNDINRGNKLGSNGSICDEYFKLIYYLWCGTESRISPRDFMLKFQKLKNQFEGYRQQDAQEFLSVLLDLLHEDLNRISNKPYIELLEKQPDEDDMIASQRWWDLHKKREDSIIVDLFNGQLKSEIICQVCGKSSITYDPFMFLCLPLPKNKIHILFKIFCGIECKILDFEYFEKSTVLDLKNRAFEFIKANKLNQTTYFDLEIVHLDYNKKVVEIISTNFEDKNYKGYLELKNLLTTKNEIIFFEKIMVNNESDYLNIFIYPIKKQTPVYKEYGRLSNLEFFTYPFFFQLKKDTKIKEFVKIVHKKLLDIDFYDKEKIEIFERNKCYSKILDLNIIHGKETKKDGFMSYFYDDTCKYCNKSYKQSFYCRLLNFIDPEATIFDSFVKFKKPLLLLATSEFYSSNRNRLIYLDSNLSNSIKSFNTVSLNDCLDLFGKDIKLEDDDMWYCSKCQKHQISMQKLQIYKPPNYLIIQLKRFNIKKKYGCNSTFTGEKNNTYVTYPLNNLDLSKYIVGPEKNKGIYDLYGIIQHFDSLNGGHYTAICYNDGSWFEYNDSSLSLAEQPINQNAYILFYKRKEL